MQRAAMLCCLALASTGHCAPSSVILLDECWAPEIVVCDVVPTEVDTLATGDKTQAKVGEFSAQLVNETGAPNIRFRGATSITLAQIPLEGLEARIWYRTDQWAAAWRMEIWAYHDTLTAGPVKVLEADLDAGGPGGVLLADDQWHQAKGSVRKCPDYDLIPPTDRLPCYVWLAPVGGWDVPHRTYVDRAELIVLDEEAKDIKPLPLAKRIRPRPGAQVNGDGWVWFEGEDAARHNVPPGGVLGPETEAEQAVLSNGAVLQYHGIWGIMMEWDVEVKDTGTYDLWCRNMGVAFKWAWDDNDWQYADQTSPWQDEVLIRMYGENPFSLLWVNLGKVELAAGKHTLQVEEGRGPEEGFAFDCWLLTTKPFTPNGLTRPEGGG